MYSCVSTCLSTSLVALALLSGPLDRLPLDRLPLDRAQHPAQSGQIGTTAIEAPDSIAHNVWLQPELRDEVLAAHAASPTFRELCRFIDRTTKLHIGIVIDPELASDRVCRAQCVMRVYTSGLISARIVLPSNRDATELVAHELEHVRERVEGLNLAALYARRAPGITRLADGRFETWRAYDLGRRVKAEVESALPVLTTSRVTP